MVLYENVNDGNMRNTGGGKYLHTIDDTDESYHSVTFNL